MNFNGMLIVQQKRIIEGDTDNFNHFLADLDGFCFARSIFPHTPIWGYVSIPHSCL